MIDWWDEHGPPAYVGVAAYLGLIGKKKKKKATSAGDGNLEELANMFGSTGGMIM